MSIKFLARNDGSFSIVKFALGDDEVDYSVIEKYGRTVGKEKVEKNTPVLEALTNGNQALKYKLVSLSNPNLIRLPGLELSGEGVSGTTITMGRNSNTTRTITVTQTIENEDAIDVELRDQAFIVDPSPEPVCVGIEAGFKKDLNSTYKRYELTRISPGIIAPTNRSPTETVSGE